MAQFIYPPVSVDTTGLATEAKQDVIISEIQDVEAELVTLNATDFATEAKQDSQITEAQATNTSLDAIEADIGSLEAKTAAGLVSEDHDYQAITYVGATTDIDTIVYKSGGAGGTTVATLTMGYDGSNRLTSVTKT